VRSTRLNYSLTIHVDLFTLKDVIFFGNRISTSLGVLFDVLFNLHKFIRFESRDPFQEKLKREDPLGSDWNRFAVSEYHRLAAEEEGGSSGYESGGRSGLGNMDVDMEGEDDPKGYPVGDDDSDDDKFGDEEKERYRGGGGEGGWYLDEDEDNEPSGFKILQSTIAESAKAVGSFFSGR